jgi:alanine dehydrogenase
MKIGIPREIKNHEYRVAITPAGVHELVSFGHELLIESNAGMGSQIYNEDYQAAGAKIIQSADQVWAQSELILKVKEPIPIEFEYLRRGQILFTYLHLAASKSCTEALLKSGITAIAYETVELVDRQLPLLAPMSEVAGRLATQVGAETLMRPNGGRGVLLAGVPGVSNAKVIVIGGGTAGINAARIALGMGADVTILDSNINRLREIDLIFNGQIKTSISNKFGIEKHALESDLIIGAVLIPGARAPKLISNELVSRLKPGSVLVDIAIDQGGCFEDSRPTTHAEPTFKVHDSIFYCVANMPGAVPNTATYALTNVTLPYVLKIANLGWRQALKSDPALAKGLNIHEGAVTYKAVADEFNLPMVDLASVLK